MLNWKQVKESTASSSYMLFNSEVVHVNLVNLWLIIFFLTQVANRVIATMRDGVFVLIVKAEPSDKEKDKDFDLTCK